MKKQYFFLILLSIIFFIPNTKASHVMGGEVSWKCLNNGQYVFYMTIYRDCTGAGWPYDTASLKIVGNPQPKNANNNIISSIILSPDSALWLQNNKGELVPKTNPGAQLSCANGDAGVLQAYYYQSDIITLNGKIPSTGWHFIFEASCCRPPLDNITTGRAPIYKATMYPYKDSTKTNCQANAPIFTKRPIPLFCLKTPQQTLNYVASANGADSITYHWDSTQNTPATHPRPVSYAMGYNYDNPLPDTSFHVNNQAANLDESSGVVDFATFSGGPQAKKYLLIVRADAWKDGKRYASVKRELPIILHDCPPLPNNQMNSPPSFSFNGQTQKNYEVHLRTGDQLSLPMQLQDQDSAANGNTTQKVRLLSYDAFSLANDRADTALCDNPPCAVFTNNVPQFDSSIMAYKLSGTNINTLFSWKPNYKHLLKNNESKPHHFYFYLQDLEGSIPSAAGSFVNVIVEPIAFRGIKRQNSDLMTVDPMPNYQWYDCDADSIIPNATSRTYTPNRSGNFAFITASKNYTDTSDCYNYNLVGIDEKVLQQQLSFYPNPTNGRVTLAFESEMKDFQLKVRNIYGQLVQNEEFVNTNKANFTIEGASGIYLIEVIDGKGRKANFKVVKQ